jgi:hypothetical protein
LYGENCGWSSDDALWPPFLFVPAPPSQRRHPRACA